MNIAHRLKARFASASLFARLLAVMFATVLIAQAVTFALVLAMPTPTPPETTIRAIAAALQAGESESGGIVVEMGPEPHDNLVDPAESVATLQLAAALGVPVDRVRVVKIRDGRAVRGGPDASEAAATAAMPIFQTVGSDTAAALEFARAGEVSGAFEAGLRQSDGRWRLATLANPPVARWQWQVLLWLMGSLAVVAPLAWLFARRIAAPIASFADAARRIGANPSVVPMAATGPPEIVAATQAVNDMQNRILRFIDDRTMMMGAMAHDLRTPLMRLSLRLQKAPEDLRRASQRDIAEIEDMTRAALAFTRDLLPPEQRHRIALRPLLETIADDFADRGDDVVLVTDGDAIVSGDIAALMRVMNNLVGNAVAYAGHARIALSTAAHTVTVAVMDDGPGIPPCELDRVFDPFYRVEKSRNRNTGGVGLGLASARAIARAHGGEITLANRPGGGVLVELTLRL